MYFLFVRMSGIYGPYYFYNSIFGAVLPSSGLNIKINTQLKEDDFPYWHISESVPCWLFARAVNLVCERRDGFLRFSICPYPYGVTFRDILEVKNTPYYCSCRNKIDFLMKLLSFLTWRQSSPRRLESCLKPTVWWTYVWTRTWLKYISITQT